MKYDLLDEILYTVAEKWSHSTLVQSKRRKIRRSADINELTGTNLKEKIWLQVECHPFLNQAKLKDFCAERGVLLTAYSPLGSPGTEGSTLGLLQNPEIQALATKYGKSTAQILIRYQVSVLTLFPSLVSSTRVLSGARPFVSCLYISFSPMQTIFQYDQLFPFLPCIMAPPPGQNSLSLSETNPTISF